VRSRISSPQPAIKTEEKQHLLELTDIGARLREISVS